MKNLVYIIAGVILSLNSGCSNVGKFISNLPPHSIPKPYKIVNPILPEKETKIPYDEIEQRGKVVVDSLKKNFPEGLVVYLKGNTIEEDRYVFFRLEDDAKTLTSSFYRFRDPEIKEMLCEFYLFHKTDRKVFFDKSAEKILEKGDYQSRIVIHDFGINGLKKSEPEDYIKFKTMGKKERILSGRKLTVEGKLVKDENPDKLLLKSSLLLRDYLKVLTSSF